jgi:signal peptidase I
MGQILEVRGSSLTGILEPGDRLMLTENKEPGLNDFVVFNEGGHQVSVKVCRGLAGDKITIDPVTREMRVNNVLLDVKLRSDAEVEIWRQWLMFQSVVPSGHMLLLGTTDDAIDSRNRGYFSLERVVGVAYKIGQENLIPVDK